MRVVPALLLALHLPVAQPAAGWSTLFNAKDLSGWEQIGEAVWTVLQDGSLVGQRDLRKVPLFSSEPEYRSWLNTQAWLYTKKEYGEFDLRLQYWMRFGGNSGVSIRDVSRARHAVTNPPDFKRTPSRIGYEIQINNHYPDNSPTGSIYTFVTAKPGVQIDDQWNTLEIEARKDIIRVRLNGQLVAEHSGDPKRALRGPIGLQLHDQYTVAMFRNIEIRER
jgi:hypothetical protein